MRDWIRIAFFSTAIVATTALPGCVVAATEDGDAGTSFVLCHLDGTMPGTPPRIVQAAKDVLVQMDMKDVHSLSTSLDGKVTASTALDTKIEITTNRRNDSSSRVSIRVGTFGDRATSLDLYEKIKAKLP